MYTLPLYRSVEAALSLSSQHKLTYSQYKLALVAGPLHAPSVTAMIPEAGMTLDSILEGILSERESEEEEAVGDHLVSDLGQSPEKFFNQNNSDKLLFYPPGYKPVQIKSEFLDSSPDNSEFSSKFARSPTSVFSTRNSNPVFSNFVKIRSNGSFLHLGTDDPDSQDSSEQSVFSIKTEIPDSCTDDMLMVCTI